MLVMNRDLTASKIPAIRASDLELPQTSDGYGGHPAAWARIWHFARTFDVSAYQEGTGTPLDGEEALRRVREAALQGTTKKLHLRDLRAALATLYWLNGQGGVVDQEDAHLVDEILDAAYARVSADGSRPYGAADPYEPQLGILGAAHGSGQHRFWLKARDNGWSRHDLFDRAAGLLLREISPHVILSALFLYPPEYSHEALDEAPTHTFMILLEPRLPSSERRDLILAAEYDRLARVVLDALSAPGTSGP